MEKYHFETFSADSRDFDQQFTSFLNRKFSESWKVKDCTYCHDASGDKMWASCLFKRKS